MWWHFRKTIHYKLLSPERAITNRILLKSINEFIQIATAETAVY